MRLIVAFLFCLAALTAQAAPSGQVDETELTVKTRELSKQLRCLVCQGENIWESNSTLAQQMRGAVRERLQAGESPEQIKDYLQSRYGDFVLMSPPKRGANWVLWLSPFVLLLIGGFLLNRTLRRWKAQTLAGKPTAPAQVSEAQRQKIEAELAKLGDD